MNRKLYVGNLPYQTTEEDLQQLFSQAGAVETVRVMRDQATGRARGFAFVEMATEADAQNAVDTLHDRALRRTQPDGQRSPAAAGGTGGRWWNVGGGGNGRGPRREPRW